MKIYIRMTTGSGYLDPAHPIPRSKAERRERIAGVPNTLPLLDLNRDTELGRVGCSSHPGQGNGVTQSPRHKTKFYNMLAKAGQTGKTPEKTRNK
jgi:hypothetical protein